MKGMNDLMTQDQERQDKAYTLRELHDKKPDGAALSKDSQIYLACANYARSAMLANLNAVLEDKSQRLYNKTDDEMISQAKVFYKDYVYALNQALMLR